MDAAFVVNSRMMAAEAIWVDVDDRLLSMDAAKWVMDDILMGETHAILLGLLLTQKHSFQHVKVVSDSMLAVLAINGKWDNCPRRLHSLVADMLNIKSSFSTCSIEHIP